MRISRNYEAEDYTSLLLDSEADWNKAVDIFLDRLETRYLEHIKAIRHRKTSGFVVVALDSVLIETLEQFHRGQSETPWGKGQEYFVAFLRRTAFKHHFDDEQARLFYTTIRCGLLHQSEAKATSRIKRGGNRPMVSYAAGRHGVIVAVDKFHDLLVEVIHDYVERLRKPESASARAMFKKKMDHICRIEGKPPDDLSSKL